MNNFPNMKKYEVTLLDSNNAAYVLEVSVEQTDFVDGSNDDELATMTAIQYLEESYGDTKPTFRLKQLHRIT